MIDAARVFIADAAERVELTKLARAIAAVHEGDMAYDADGGFEALRANDLQWIRLLCAGASLPRCNRRTVIPSKAAKKLARLPATGS